MELNSDGSTRSPASPTPWPAGLRFRARYQLRARDEVEARSRLKVLCHEQSVELPPALITDPFIAEEIVGRLESLSSPVDMRGERGEEREGAGELFEASVSFRCDCISDGSRPDIPQLLNVAFGNSSIKLGLKLLDLELPEPYLARLQGPRFGVEGLRAHLATPTGPMLCAALKPMGSSTEQLAALAYEFALGGVQLIKDDHGLLEQPWSPWRERVARCVDAVERANRETGLSCRYAPTLPSRFDGLIEAAREAKSLGAGALLAAPGLAGFDALRVLAEDDAIALPLISHPTLLGAQLIYGGGMSHRLLLGTLQRLIGADVVIFPNFGGRFGFSEGECRSIVEGCAAPLGGLRRALPSPGGGMTFDRAPALARFYGDQVVHLMGGGLYERPEGLRAAARGLAALLRKAE